MICWACHREHDAHYVTPAEAAQHCKVTIPEIYLWVRLEKIRVTTPRSYASRQILVDLGCEHVQKKLGEKRFRKKK